MAYITLASVTIPTPEPFVDKVIRNNENFYFVMLQVLQQMQATGFKIPDKDEVTRLVTEIVTLNTKLEALKTAVNNLNLSVPAPDLTALTQAIKDLQYNDNVIDFGVFRIELRGRYKET